MKEVGEIKNDKIIAVTYGDNLKHDWKVEEILKLFALPFNDLIFNQKYKKKANC